MKKCLTTTYKVSDDNIIDKINNKSQEIISSKYFNLKNKKIPMFLTVTDHKKDFPLNIELRTINPSKNLLGKISKNILEDIVTEIKKKTTIIQWKNTYELIKWFDQIKDKSTKCFVNFDIQKFYTGIKLKHLKNTIVFTRKFTDINEVGNKETNIMSRSRNSVIYYNVKYGPRKIKTQLLTSLWGHILMINYAI